MSRSGNPGCRRTCGFLLHTCVENARLSLYHSTQRMLNEVMLKYCKCCQTLSIALHENVVFLTHSTNIPLPYDSLPFMAVEFGDILTPKFKLNYILLPAGKFCAFFPSIQRVKGPKSKSVIFPLTPAPTPLPPEVYSALLCVLTAQTCYHNVNVQLTGISRQACPDLTLNASTLGKRILIPTVEHAQRKSTASFAYCTFKRNSAILHRQSLCYTS